MEPSFARDLVTCRAHLSRLHLYEDPVMVSCGHVFCRSCCLSLAVRSQNQIVTCPTCGVQIPFDNLKQFATSLVTHGTLASLVERYINDQKVLQFNQRSFNKENEETKMRIIRAMDYCEQLLTNDRIETIKNLHHKTKEFHQVLQQRFSNLKEKLNRYETTLLNSLSEQAEANEMTFVTSFKHQTIDVQCISTSMKSQLGELRNRIDFLEYMRVEQYLRRLNDEADRQLRFLKHRADSVPVLSSPIVSPSNYVFGEFRFRLIAEDKCDNMKTKQSTIDRPTMNVSGDTSLQSIAGKCPMWSTVLPAHPLHLGVYPFGKSSLLFSCSSDGILSVLSYSSPVTHESARLIRTFHLFPTEKHVRIQSLTIFNRFIMIHAYFTEQPSENSKDFGFVYFFNHDGTVQHEPIALSHRVDQYVADETRLWAIDCAQERIFCHLQPAITKEIQLSLMKEDHFLSFQASDTFHPYRLAANYHSLAVLAKDLEQIYIYNKFTRELIFTSRFTVGHQMTISSMALFPRDNSLLLHFNLSSNERIKRSLFIHFNSKNQSVGRIEGKNCLSSVIGPHQEILIGFSLRTGIVRCFL